MKGDETFVVYSRPLAWLSLAVLAVGLFIAFSVMVVGLWRVDPGILTERGVLLILTGLAFSTFGLSIWAWRWRKARYVILSADALGVWAGHWGQRQVWAQVALIRRRRAPGDMIGPERFLTFEPPDGAGRWGGRMVDLRRLARPFDEVMVGIRAAAISGGYHLQEVEPGRVWQVERADG